MKEFTVSHLWSTLPARACDQHETPMGVSITEHLLDGLVSLNTTHNQVGRLPHTGGAFSIFEVKWGVYHVHGGGALALSGAFARSFTVLWACGFLFLP